MAGWIFDKATGGYVDNQGNWSPNADGSGSMTLTAAYDSGAIKPGSSGPGGDGGTVGPQDYTSWSGLPKWAEKGVRGVWGKYGKGFWRNYDQALGALDQNPALIEQQRKLMDEQFTRGLQMPTLNAIRNATAGSAGRGVLGSSSYDEQVQGIAASAQRAAGDQSTRSSLWAADALQKNIRDKISARQAGVGMLGEHLGLAKKSVDPTAWMRMFD